MAATYRAPIFKKMDSEFDIDWYYGYQIGDIKEMNPEELKSVTRVERKEWKGIVWQKGIINLLFDKRYQQFLMLGEPTYLSTWCFLILKKLFRQKKKIYFWTHGWYGRESFIKKWLKRVFFGLADGSFVYGNFAREQAIKQGNDSDKLWVIHNSLDYGTHLKMRSGLQKSGMYKSHFNNDFPTLIFIGRLTKVKHLDLSIRAVKDLQDNGEDYNLVLVGDGSEKESLNKLAKDLNINVWFYGSCYDDTETAQLIYDADLCVSPGNVGLTSIHSLSFGTPVLTHDNFPNQMPEFEAVVDGKTGTFFKEGDVASLASNISAWFAAHPDRDEVRAACYAEVDSSWNPDFQTKVLKRVIC